MNKNQDDMIRLSSEKLRLLQLNELAILVELDRICRKNHIYYTLAGGTLLGAVRHKGFIPWDDDVDVRFTRSEYERFFEACKIDMDSAHFFLQDYRTDPNYRWGYAKMRLLGTEYIRLGQEHMKYRTGVCIDIFITDNVPDSNLGRRYLWDVCFCLRKLLYSELGMKSEKSAIKRMWYRILYTLVPRDWCFDKLEKLIEKYNSKETKGGRTYTWYEEGLAWNRVCDNSFFKAYVELDFEGMRLFAIKEYDRYLKLSYGDYMQLPPEDKRLPSGPASKIELLNITIDEIQEKYRMYCEETEEAANE